MSRISSRGVAKISGTIAILLILFSLSFLGGCVSTPKDTGKTISKELCDKVQKDMTKDDVLRILGEPDSSTTTASEFLGNTEHLSFRSGNQFIEKGSSHSCSVQMQQGNDGVYRVKMKFYNNM